ncbi:hypothetical protein TUBRATIS_18190 [Tubulinosema ratisbonensis]|uniref:Uncharacterized protein n=1 Tax=Tubulinosema ratisbonensis TaxID=291195 RepID=A0A437AKZ1_9MICR|nr:hypothetical protein TUBRATIS_18190 [Tubulinosema ratisbonensis]
MAEIKETDNSTCTINDYSCKPIKVFYDNPDSVITGTYDSIITEQIDLILINSQLEFFDFVQDITPESKKIFVENNNNNFVKFFNTLINNFKDEKSLHDFLINCNKNFISWAHEHIQNEDEIEFVRKKLGLSDELVNDILRKAFEDLKSKLIELYEIQCEGKLTESIIDNLGLDFHCYSNVYMFTQFFGEDLINIACLDDCSEHPEVVDAKQDLCPMLPQEIKSGILGSHIPKNMTKIIYKFQDVKENDSEQLEDEINVDKDVIVGFLALLFLGGFLIYLIYKKIKVNKN